MKGLACETLLHGHRSYANCCPPGGETPRLTSSRRLITGIASSSHTVEYTSFGEAVRSLANFHVKQKAATSLSSINSSQRKLSARSSCSWSYVIHKPHRNRDSTTGREYHFKGREPSEGMLRAVYTRFNTLPPSLYTLDVSNAVFFSNNSYYAIFRRRNKIASTWLGTGAIGNFLYYTVHTNVYISLRPHPTDYSIGTRPVKYRDCPVTVGDMYLYRSTSYI